MDTKDLSAEAEAFDKRVQERLDNGMIPDLNKTRFNPWFFNNPWRKPEYVDMVFGDYYRFAKAQIEGCKHVLEVGSGLGHMCLQFARDGFDVTGLELSKTSTDTAVKFADKELLDSGKLKYVNSDFLSWEAPQKFDAICFILTLHHFQNLDEIMERCQYNLKEGGRIIVIEPARDLFSERNAALVALVRGVLSLTGNWHAPVELDSNSKMADYTQEVLNEYRDAKDKDENEQSPNDNDAFARDMIDALDRHFQRETLTHGNSIVPRMVGGIRADNEHDEMKLARLIKMFDDFATASGYIDPGVFFYSGILTK